MFKVASVIPMCIVNIGRFSKMSTYIFEFFSGFNNLVMLNIYKC